MANKILCEYMHERWNELERGKSAQETKRKHIPTWLFKLADNLDYLYNQLQKTIENISMIGMKKDKAQAVSLLSQFVPKAQKFSSKVNSYNDYIQELEERINIQKSNNKELINENRQLKNKIIDKDFETDVKLRNMQNQVKKYEKYIKRVPKEILDEIEAKEREREHNKEKEMKL